MLKAAPRIPERAISSQVVPVFGHMIVPGQDLDSDNEDTDCNDEIILGHAAIRFDIEPS